MSHDLPPFTWHELATTWVPHPVWDTVMVLALVGYVTGLVLARQRGERPVHPARVGCFVLGLALLAGTLNTAVERYSHLLFWDHMVQHLLLIMVVPALLVLGHPLTVLTRAAAGRPREMLDRALGSRPVTLLTHPLVGLAVYTVVIVATHLTSFMNAMATRMWLHQSEQLLYVVAGLVFLLPLVGDEPIRHHRTYIVRFLALIVAMVPDTVVGIVLLQNPINMFPARAVGRPGWAPTAVEDQHIGGALMWAGGDGLMMLLITGVIVAYIAHSEQNATAGAWLEGVRRSTMARHVGQVGQDDQDSQADPTAEEPGVDEDEEMLEAYNRMLARMHERGR